MDLDELAEWAYKEFKSEPAIHNNKWNIDVNCKTDRDGFPECYVRINDKTDGYSGKSLLTAKTLKLIGIEPKVKAVMQETIQTSSEHFEEIKLMIGVTLPKGSWDNNLQFFYNLMIDGTSVSSQNVDTLYDLLDEAAKGFKKKLKLDSKSDEWNGVVNALSSGLQKYSKSLI